MKIMGMMASLPRDTMSKACRRAFISIEAVVKDGGNHLKRIENIYPNVHFQKVLHIYSKINCLIAFCLETLTLGLIYSVHPVEEELGDLFSITLPSPDQELLQSFSSHCTFIGSPARRLPPHLQFSRRGARR